MMRFRSILNLPLSTLIKEEYKNIKDSKHSPVYRKSGVEGFAPLFSFFSVNLGKVGSKMKIAIRLVFLLSVILFANVRLQAQSIKPVIDLAYVDPDNPLIAFETAAIIVHVKILNAANNDTGNFWGNLKYNLQSDKMGAEDDNWKLSVDNDTADEYILPGGKVDTLYFTVDTALFKTTGTTPPINVIIIWPAFISPSLEMVDSGEFIIWEVPGFIGIFEEGPQKFGSTVFPNPADGLQLVFIDSKYSKEIRQVSIMNGLGQVINRKEFAEGEDSNGYILPTEDLRTGIYHIHIIYRDNKSEVVKFIKN